MLSRGGPPPREDPIVTEYKANEVEIRHLSSGVDDDAISQIYAEGREKLNITMNDKGIKPSPQQLIDLQEHVINALKNDPEEDMRPAPESDSNTEWLVIAGVGAMVLLLVIYGL